MRKSSLFGGLCAAAVITAAIMSIGFGDWFIWVPVLAALASVASLRKTMSRGHDHRKTL